MLQATAPPTAAAFASPPPALFLSSCSLLHCRCARGARLLFFAGRPIAPKLRPPPPCLCRNTHPPFDALLPPASLTFDILTPPPFFASFAAPTPCVAARGRARHPTRLHTCSAPFCRAHHNSHAHTPTRRALSPLKSSPELLWPLPPYSPLSILPPPPARLFCFFFGALAGCGRTVAASPLSPPPLYLWRPCGVARAPPPSPRPRLPTPRPPPLFLLSLLSLPHTSHPSLLSTMMIWWWWWWRRRGDRYGPPPKHEIKQQMNPWLRLPPPSLPPPPPCVLLLLLLPCTHYQHSSRGASPLPLPPLLRATPVLLYGRRRRRGRGPAGRLGRRWGSLARARDDGAPRREQRAALLWPLSLSKYPPLSIHSPRRHAHAHTCYAHTPPHTSTPTTPHFPFICVRPFAYAVLLSPGRPTLCFFVRPSNTFCLRNNPPPNQPPPPQNARRAASLAGGAISFVWYNTGIYMTHV